MRQLTKETIVKKLTKAVESAEAMYEARDESEFFLNYINQGFDMDYLTEVVNLAARAPNAAMAEFVVDGFTEVLELLYDKFEKDNLK